MNEDRPAPREITTAELAAAAERANAPRSEEAEADLRDREVAVHRDAVQPADRAVDRAPDSSATPLATVTSTRFMGGALNTRAASTLAGR